MEPGNLAAKRGHRKVPAFRPSWTADEVALLGTDHDAVIANMEHVAVATGD